MIRIFIFFFAILFYDHVAVAQVIDHTSTFKGNSDKYIRIHYDNDFFTKTDYYYTQGINLEMALPSLKSSPLNKLLVKTRSSDHIYGLAIDHFGYTPTSTRSDSILVGNRPYAGNLTISSFITSMDPVKNRRITSAITLGIMGPGAGGKEMQETIHRWIGYRQPKGWQFQMHNDIILTYTLKYERELLRAANYFLLNAAGEVKAGTHTNRVKGGINFVLGNFDDPYRSRTHEKKTRYYFYGQLQPRFTIYDATLQGGLFNRNSLYTLSSSSIKRFGVQGDYGVVLRFPTVYLEYCQSILSKEFATGRSHRWGGLRIGVDL